MSIQFKRWRHVYILFLDKNINAFIQGNHDISYVLLTEVKSCFEGPVTCQVIFFVFSVFQMVVLDVVIIGGGPHALTLASLLSIPGHDLSLSGISTAPKSPRPKLEPFNTQRSSGKKKKRKAAVGAA